MRKWKCVKKSGGGSDFTVGKIYESDEEGFGIVDDAGFEFSTLSPLYETSNRRGFIITKFEEVFDKKEDKVMKFDIKKEKIAVLCDTEEKVEKLCEMLGEKMFKNFRADNQAKCYVGYDWEASGYVDGLLYDSYSYFTNKTKKYKLITFEEFMGEKEDIKMEFKVGDRVEILGGTKQKYWTSDGRMKKYIGTKGNIIGIRSDEPKFKVKMDIDKDYWFFNTEDLKLITEVKLQQFTITISDSITTLETNGKKVEIKRYYTDKHDVEFAMQEVVNKYFDEVRKEDMEAKLPKVGDKVRVIDDGLTYPMFSEWLVQNNASVKSAIKWKMDAMPIKGKEYIVELIVDGKVLIEDELGAYIIAVEGLEVVR